MMFSVHDVWTCQICGAVVCEYLANVNFRRDEKGCTVVCDEHDGEGGMGSGGTRADTGDRGVISDEEMSDRLRPKSGLSSLTPWPEAN